MPPLTRAALLYADIDEDSRGSAAMALTAEPARKAIPRTSGLPGGRLYDAADLLVWLAGLNLLVVVFTLLGGVVLGLAPALVAAATVSRTRVRGDGEPLLRTFARVWRRELVRANLLLAPFGLVAALLGTNIATFAPTGGPLVPALWVALALVALAATFALTLYTHYELPLGRYATTAVRYLAHDLPATVLVAAVTAVAALVVWFAPGLLPVLAIGGWIYTVTAICVSCFARNDRLVAAHTPMSDPARKETR
ncbi:hypothetical protein GCM10027212_08020 [Actinotalea caeni]